MRGSTPRSPLKWSLKGLSSPTKDLDPPENLVSGVGSHCSCESSGQGTCKYGGLQKQNKHLPQNHRFHELHKPTDGTIPWNLKLERGLDVRNPRSSRFAASAAGGSADVPPSAMKMGI